MAKKSLTSEFEEVKLHNADQFWKCPWGWYLSMGVAFGAGSGIWPWEWYFNSESGILPVRLVFDFCEWDLTRNNDMHEWNMTPGVV